MKICTKCKENKDLSEFGKRSGQKYLKSHCKHCCSGFAKKWNINNVEKCQKIKKQWDKLNPERLKNNKERWNATNPSYNAFSKAKRRASLLQRTPKWLTTDDLNKIKLLYKFSVTLKKILNISYHVDHIIPLQGKTVSGLHVPWNLQILSATQNRSKSNKLI